MDIKDIDFNELNAVDMECSVADDDDSFTLLKPSKKPASFESDDSQYEDRNLVSKTGVLIDLSDDEDSRPMKKIVITDLDKMHEPDIDSSHISDIDSVLDNIQEFNAVDMECSVGEDDDFETPAKYKDYPLDEDADPEIVNSEILEERKSSVKSLVNQGTVEDDYYEKLKKKHAATNVKGSYNTHFHLSGDPKRDMEEFNHDMTPAFSASYIATPIANQGGAAKDVEPSLETAFAESSESSKPRKLLEDFLTLAGFEMTPVDGDKICLKDICKLQPDAVCTNLEDLKKLLTPYVEDFIIIPLQIETGENFSTCEDWLKWYGDEMKMKYPGCKQDIDFCNLYANHLNDCELFGGKKDAIDR